MIENFLPQIFKIKAIRKCKVCVLWENSTVHFNYLTIATFSLKIQNIFTAANEVWSKVICLQVCVCPQGGAWSDPGGSGPTAAGGTHPTGMHSCL